MCHVSTGDKNNEEGKTAKFRQASATQSVKGVRKNPKLQIDVQSEYEED